MGKIEDFLRVDEFPNGSGYGSGDGDGDGYGSGDGYGYGYGSGYGNGSGDGSGSGSGNGLLMFDKNTVHMIDGVQTIIHSVKNNIAKASIVNDDLTVTPCYVAKVGYYFAHGETIKQAIADAENKHFENIDVEERIAEFHKVFPDKSKKYSNKLFYDWHTKLTGSCTLGKDNFVSNKGIDLNGKMTVVEFIELTKNHYGGDVIHKLENTK